MEIQVKKFHQLSLDELYQILKLRVDVFVVEQKCAYPEIDDSDQEAVHMFIKGDHRVKAYLRILKTDDTTAKIGRVVTADDFRGNGSSRALMAEALQVLQRDEKTTNVVLQAQDYLTGFYASFGFEKKSDVYLEDGIPHVDMGLTIKN